MIQRHLEQKLRAAAGQYSVVLLTGPRQSGKTTLVPIEIKSGQTFAADFLQGLTY